MAVTYLKKATKTPESETGQAREVVAEMLSRIDTSVKLLRQQIVQNQSAPFLADLYLQLGQLLSQKANVLYYLKMEERNRTETVAKVDLKEFYDVVETQKEAIVVYELIIEQFPGCFD